MNGYKQSHGHILFLHNNNRKFQRLYVITIVRYTAELSKNDYIKNSVSGLSISVYHYLIGIVKYIISNILDSFFSFLSISISK
jgi:hypothetical protein